MQFNAKERTFEISIRVFTDDLENALSRTNGGHRVQLALSGAVARQQDALIEPYLRRHFAVLTGGRQRRPYAYVGHETEADAQWLYVELPFAEPFENVVLQQAILTDLFDDQVNVVNIQYLGQKKTMVFRKSQPVQPVTFN